MTVLGLETSCDETAAAVVRDGGPPQVATLEHHGTSVPSVLWLGADQSMLVGTAAARSLEAWFFESTEAGQTALAARRAIKDGGGPFPFWFYMAPGHR